MTDIDLGFAEECEGKWLTNAHFPSKIGGKPAWLHLGILPSSETLRCSKCGNPKSFLCQIYAPFEDEDNFHRTIYVFVCRMESCYTANDNGCVTVLRSQLPLHNKFYPDVPPPEDGEAAPEVTPTSKLCVACGCFGGLKCSRCKYTNYCGAGHQRLHWKYHKLQCTSENTENETSGVGEPIKEIIFPEWEICMNPDGESDEKSKDAAKKNQVNEQDQLDELNKLISTGKAGHFQDLPESELEKYNSCYKVDDKDFRTFRKECAKDPEQIIRYKRNGQPLWIANPERTIKDILSSIPDCSLCGFSRQFEFQIMPQMLNYLQDSIVDWGVLAIYTCSKSCRLPEDRGYTDEFVIKQDINTSGK